MNKWIVLLVFTGSIIFTSPVFASEGTGARGGGSMLLLDGKWELFELVQMKGQTAPSYRLSANTIGLLKNMRSLFEAYTGIRAAHYWDELYGSYADYRVTDKLPCETTHKIKGLTYGCTLNGVTYLHPTYFFKSLNSVSQLFALLHERGHVMDAREDAHAWIEPFVQGMYVLTQLRAEQEKGLFRELVPTEMHALDGLLHTPRIRQALDPANLTEDSRHQEEVYPYGGGVISIPLTMQWEHVHMNQVNLSVDSRLEFSKCGWKNNYQSNNPIEVRNSNIYSSLVECASIKDSMILNSNLQFRIKTSSIIDPLVPNMLAIVSGMHSKGSTMQIRGKAITIRNSAVDRSILILLGYPRIVSFDDANITQSSIDYSVESARLPRVADFFVTGKVKSSRGNAVPENFLE